MKINLGNKILLLFIFSLTVLSAGDYKWSATINKTKALVNEAVYLKYTCEFTNDEGLYTINFNPLKKHEKYDIYLLREDEKKIDDKRVNTYEFIVYAKKIGQIDFDFEIIMKKTTIESIRELTGGLDNDKAKESFTNVYLKQKILSLNVKESKESLVGDFSIEIKKDKPEKMAFLPYHMEVIIKGTGNFNALKDLVFNIKDVKVFSQNPVLDVVLTKNGYSGRWSQKYAFVGNNDFEVPAFSFYYTNPINLKKVKLNSKKISVKISKAYEKEKLLDVKEKEFEFEFKYIYFLLTFVAGFLLSKIKLKKDKQKDKKTMLFEDKVKNINSLDELHIMLIMQDSLKYKNLIDKIESKEIKSISKAKKILYVS